MTNIYFITGGGTGGHIYPAIAVADELLKDNDTKIFYVGNPNKMEFSIVKNKDYVFLPVNSSGMPRKFSLEILFWIFQMFFATIKCCFYILKYKPKAVFGTGGYVSAPALFAAIIMKIPFIMHDCDANPGLVTRKLSPFASSISLAFEQAKNKINNKNCFVNGNPIREQFRFLSKEQAKFNLGLDNRLTICIFGGSQGANTINNVALNILKNLLVDYNLQVIFQTGDRNYNSIITKLETLYPDYISNKSLIIKPYFDDMVTVLKASDIAISRAGSLSISEICASGVVPVFIPYPFAAQDHQRKNAKCMVEKNAGFFIDDKELTVNLLLNTIKDIITNNDKFELLKRNVLNQARYNSTQDIVNQIKRLA